MQARWGLLIAALTAPLMACGGGEKGKAPGTSSTQKGGEPSAAPSEVVVWHTYRDLEAKALDAVAAQWNASPEGKQHPVRLEANPYDGFADKLTAAVPRGNGPDLFIFAHDRIGGWAKSGVVAPLQEEVGAEEGLIDAFWPETLRPLEFGEQLYGLPLAYKSAVLFYNTALVKEPPKDTEALFALAKSLAATPEAPSALAYPHSQLFHHSPWLFGFGGKVLDGDQPALNTPENAKSLDFVKRLVTEGVVPKEVSPADMASLFNAKKAAMVINGPWFRGEIAPETQYQVAPLPVISEIGQPAKPFLTIEAVMVSPQTKDKKAAFAFAKFLATEGAAARLREGKQSVAAKAPYELPEAKADAVLQVFLQQLKQSAPTPNVPAMNAVWSPFDKALEAAIAGGTESGAALAQAQEKALGK